jgi:hypothetical protein
MLSKQIEIRGSILDTIPDTKSGPNQGVSTQSRAEINSFEDEDSKPVPKSLTEEGSVRGRSLPIFIICRINQDLSNLLQGTCLTSHGGSVKPLTEDINQDQSQFVVFVFVKYGPTRIFSQYFQSDNR